MRLAGKLITTCAVAAVALATSNPALAAQEQQASTAVETATSSTQPDTGIGEIVVTAQRREESVQTVPIAITAISGDALTASGVRNVVELSSTVPSLMVRSTNPTAIPMIYLRGVGSSDFNPNTAAPVSVYVDGMYIGSQAGQLGAYTDLARVEVLRGPQGTLYGRNTTGGAINVISARPTNDLTSFAQIEAGRFNTVNVTGAVGGAIVRDLLQVRLSGSYLYRDGFARNDLTGSDLRNARKGDGRLSVLFTPSADLEFLGHVAWAQADSTVAFQPIGIIPRTAEARGSDGFCKPAFYNTPACTDIVGYSDTDGDPYRGKYYIDSPVGSRDFRADLTSTWDLGGASLISVTGYDFGRTYEYADVTGGPQDLLTATYEARQRQFSEELRLQSNAKTGTTWVIGAFYLHDSVDNRSAYDILRVLRPLYTTPTNPTGLSIENNVVYFGYPSTQITKSYAVFGQIDYSMTDRITLTGGLRYSRDDKTLDYKLLVEGVIPAFAKKQSRSFDDISGRLGIEYKIRPDAMVYATFNRGYRSGGFFGGFATSPAQLDPYNNETVNAYEAGTKLTLADRKVRVNLSGFYYDYQNLQVFSVQQRGGISVQVLNNAANARIYGGEAELTLAPVRDLQLTSSVSLLSARYLNFNSAGRDLSNNQMPSAPKFTFSAGATYAHEFSSGWGVETTESVSYRSSSFFTAENQPGLKQPGYWLVNARAGLTKGPIGFGVYAQNLFDTRYASNATAIESLGTYMMVIADPRTYGAYLRFRY